MRLKNTTAYSYIAYVALACQLLTWIGRPMNIHILVSISVAATTIAVAMGFLFLYIDRSNAQKNNDFAFLVIMFLLVAFCAAVTHPINMTLLKKLLVFFQLPILMAVAKRGRTERTQDVIYTVNAFYPILCVHYYRSSFAYQYMGPYGPVELDVLTLGFGNPNETAIYLMLCGFLLLAAFFRYKTLFKRTVLAVEFLWIMFLVYKTDCRAVVFVLAMVFLTTAFWKKMSLNKKFIRTIFLGTALFTVVLFILPTLGRMTFMDEALDTGRTAIFERYLNSLKFDSFLRGDFQRYPLINMHNAFLSLLAAFGILAAIVCWCFYYRGFLNVCAGKPRSMEQKVLQLSCMAIVIHSTVEASVLTSGAIYAVSTFLVLFATAGAENEKSE